MGSNVEGQLGIGDRRVIEKSAPVLVESIIVCKPTKINAGAYHSTWIMKNGELYTWGRGSFGCLGLEDEETQFSPFHVKFNEAIYPLITEVSAGNSHTIWLDERGSVYTFGNNGKSKNIYVFLEHGQLGLGTRENVFSPYLVRSIAEVVIKVAAGGSHSLVVTKSGKILSSGLNDQGQLGTGDNRPTVLFTMLKDMEHINIINVDAGNQHSAAISSSKELYIWGTECFGEFLIPHLVKSIKGRWTQVSLG